MKIIKLTTPWKNAFLKDQLDANIVDYKFEIDNDCNVCDYWIIWGDLPNEYERKKVRCPPFNVIYMTDEAHEKKVYNQKFLDQFNYVITCRNDIYHKNLIRTHEINQWQLSKTSHEVSNTDNLIKTKNLSVVCSDLTILNGHKKRYAFVNKLIGHFKDRIDVYGRGFNPIDDKWEALAPYKYSVAIENSVVPGYFTEKITECYLANTLPIYFGAPDITDYFDSASLVKIDLDDYKSSINAIEKLIEEDPWDSLQSVLIQQKRLYLAKYHLFPALCNIINQLPLSQQVVKSNTIKGHETFYSYYRLRKTWQLYKHHLYK